MEELQQNLMQKDTKFVTITALLTIPSDPELQTLGKSPGFKEKSSQVIFLL